MKPVQKLVLGAAAVMALVAEYKIAESAAVELHSQGDQGSQEME